MALDARGVACAWSSPATTYHCDGMPTQAQIDFFARWNDAARRSDRAEERAATMAERLDEAARLSAAATSLSVGTGRVEPDAERR